MKYTLLISMLASALSLASHALAEGESAAVTTTEITSDLGYYFGYSFGNMLGDSGASDVDVDRLIQGLKDSLAQTPPNLTSEQRERIYEEIRARQTAAQAQKQQVEQAAVGQSETNLAAAKSFLIENAKRPEVKATATGLQYEMLVENEGPTAIASSHVSVNYIGSFTNGEVFHQSSDEPAEFGLNQVIVGWTEALQLMSVGDKYKFYVPPELGYGSGGVGRIPPNSLLVFEIELLEIK